MEKRSYFNVGRKLTDEEYAELRNWVKQNPTKRWKLRDVNPVTKKIFWSYDKRSKNGEQWTTQKTIDKRTLYQNKWIDDNRERVNEMGLARFHIYKEKDRDKYRKSNRTYYKNRTEQQKERTRERARINQKKRRETDPVFKMAQDMRNRVKGLFRERGFRKNSKTEEILGISFSGFKDYIESLFEPWVNWENRGGLNITAADIGKKWDLEHSIPLSSAKTEEDLLNLCHYTNIRPMCSYTNRHIKGDKLDWQNG